MATTSAAPQSGISSRASQLEELLKQSITHTHDALGVLEGWRRLFFEVDTLIADVTKRAAHISNLRDSFCSARDRVDEIQENLDTAKQVERQITAGPAADFAGFLRAFDRLDHSAEFVRRHEQLVPKEATTGDLLKLRDTGLKLSLDYYTQLLRQHTTVPNAVLWSGEGMDASSTDGVELMRPNVCKRLKRLTDLLLRHKIDKACTVYVEARRGVLQRLMPNLAIEQLKDPAVTLETLQDKIASWILGVRACARLVVLERQLASTVFSPPYNDHTFYKVMEPTLREVLALGIAITHAHRLHEKLFGLLEMHEQLHRALPLLSVGLRGLECVDHDLDRALEKVLLAYDTLGQDLQTEARAVFVSFCEALKHPTTRDLPMTGSVHRFTVYSLNYIKRLFQSPDGTTITFGTGQPTRVLQQGRQHGDRRTNDPQQHERTLVQLRKVLDLLVANVKAKSAALQQQGKAALSCVFMMNNLHHIVTRVNRRESPLVSVGEAWVQRVEDEVEACGQRYIQVTWGPLIALVKGRPSELGKEKVKEHLKQIKQRVEEIEVEQRGWQIPDDSLRENLRICIVEDFVNQYQEYLQDFRAAFPNKVVRYEQKYIKYSGEDLRMLVFHKLFTGGTEDPGLMLQVGR